jgi:hypothetical protein
MHHLRRSPVLPLRSLPVNRFHVEQRRSSSLVLHRDQCRHHLRLSPNIKSTGEPLTQQIRYPRTARPPRRVVGTAEIHSALRRCGSR